MKGVSFWNETRLSFLSKGKQDNGVKRTYKELTVCTRSGVYSEQTVNSKVEKLEMEEAKEVRHSKKLAQWQDWGM